MSDHEGEPEFERRMEHLADNIESLRKEVTDVRVEVAGLPSKAGMWLASASFALIVAVSGAAFFLGTKLEILNSNDRAYARNFENLRDDTTDLAAKAATLEQKVSEQGVRLDALVTEVRLQDPPTQGANRPRQ